MPSRKPYNVAIVDDERSVLEALGNLLEAVGYSVRCFDSAEAFLTSDSVESVHCLISDIGMPGMNGIALQGEMARLRPMVPVFLITGRTVSGTPGLEAPNHRGLFRKPCDVTQLLDGLASALADSGSK